MIYLKVLDADGNFVSAEAIETPIYVKYQSRNKLLLQCPALHAQGIVSANGSETYQLDGRDAIPGMVHTAVFITQADYELLKDTDPEDNNPTPPDDPGTEVLTRAQLTAKVAELEETNTMLMECVLGMSETCYACHNLALCAQASRLCARFILKKRSG